MRSIQFRRFQKQKYRNKAKEIVINCWHIEPRFAERCIHLTEKNRTPCSCFMCSPKKLEGEKFKYKHLEKDYEETKSALCLPKL